MDRFEREFCDKAIAEMGKNEKAFVTPKYSYTSGWANIRVSNSTEANVVAFLSGSGDGGYVSYWGYDQDNNLACLVTDFALFYEDPAITKKIEEVK